MYMVVLGVLLLLMKVTELGPVAGMPWWAVLLPFGLAILWWAWADSTGWTKRREMDKMEQKKKDRRVKNLDALGMDSKGRRGRRS